MINSGKLFLTASNVLLYPYGSAAKDKVLYDTDDGNTVQIPLNQGFLYYGRILTSAFVSKLSIKLIKLFAKILAY